MWEITQLQLNPGYWRSLTNSLTGKKKIKIPTAAIPAALKQTSHPRPKPQTPSCLSVHGEHSILVHTFLAVTSRWETNKRRREEERVKFTIIKLKLPVGKIKAQISHVHSAGRLSGLDGLISQWQTCSCGYLTNISISTSITSVCIYNPCCQELYGFLPSTPHSCWQQYLYKNRPNLTHSLWLQCQGNIKPACDSVLRITPD